MFFATSEGIYLKKEREIISFFFQKPLPFVLDPAWKAGRARLVGWPRREAGGKRSLEGDSTNVTGG